MEREGRRREVERVDGEGAGERERRREDGMSKRIPSFPEIRGKETGGDGDRRADL